MESLPGSDFEVEKLAEVFQLALWSESLVGEGWKRIHCLWEGGWVFVSG